MTAEKFFSLVSQSGQAGKIDWQPSPPESAKQTVDFQINGVIASVALNKVNGVWQVSDLTASQFFRLHNIKH